MGPDYDTDYGSIGGAEDDAARPATPPPPPAPEPRRARGGAHERGPSHAMYSRRRRRTMRTAEGPDRAGDFVIHDFMNAKTRTHVSRARAAREAGGGGWYHAKIYFVLVVLGVGAGAIAAVLDLVVDWLTDAKFGACRQGWYLSRAVCCHSAADLEDCKDFVLWTDRIGVASGGFGAFLVFSAFAMLFAGVAAYLVKRFAPYAAGSGVPEIKTVLSGVELKGYLSLWAMVVKIIGLGFAVASGLNLGKEGPFVHLASALASIVAGCFEDLRSNFNLMLELITSGTAAGVSVAFNAPIGGVLFAFEEASMYFPNHVLWRSFFASTLAALTLKVLNPFLNGRVVMFEVDHSLEWKWVELVPFAVVGVLGGLIGVIFIKFNVMWTKYRLHNPFMRRSAILEAVVLVAFTGLLSFFVDFLKLTNNEILTTLFSECSNLSAKEDMRAAMLCHHVGDGVRWRMYTVLIYGAVIKLFLTILTFGCRVPAGLFIPSMTIGACMGRVIGEMTKSSYVATPDAFIFAECASSSACIRPSIYALVGASAALAGVTQVSVSLVVIMFELTGGLGHLLPTMVGILFAKMVCNLFGYDEGIYDTHINMKRYPYLGVGEELSHEVHIDEIMRVPSCVLPQMGCTIGHLQQVLASTTYYGFPIVRTQYDMILTGNIVRSELERAIAEALASDPQVNADTRVIFNGKLDPDESRELASMEAGGHLVMRFAEYRDGYLSQVVPETPIADVASVFTDLGVRMCFVTRHGRLLGLVSKKDIIAYVDVAEHVDKRFFGTTFFRV